ncbi:MAG: hypothetical protein IPM21_03890 [Acidobacteria bacterium]|nr:hypothetical protein [Acidobacteriota bacterium]
MKPALLLLLLCLFTFTAEAQRRSRARTPQPPEVGKTAVVMDETISVLRDKPSLFANAVQRMRRGRIVKILGVAEADGVRFFRVSAVPPAAGWLQADSVFGKFRPADEERFVSLIQASSGFEQVELATHFLKLYPASSFRPAVLLLYGDLLEDAATRLSRDANNRLDRREMAASGAPVHSYYLNFVSLDRYRRLGIRFVFNSSTRRFHYDGESWAEVVRKHAASPESAEAQKRLDSLKEKMERTESR